MTYGYQRPKSRILIRGIVKDVARQYVENRVAPRGSIWCPGDIMGDRPDIGDLYGPNPAWQRPWPLDSKPVAAGTLPDAVGKRRMIEMLRKFHDGIPINDQVARVWAKMEPYWTSGNPAYAGAYQPPKPPPRTDEERMADLLAHAGDPIEVSETLKRKLGFTNATDGEDGHGRDREAT